MTTITLPTIISRDIEVIVTDTEIRTIEPIVYQSILEISLPIYRLQAILGNVVAIEPTSDPHDIHIDEKFLRISLKIIHG